VDDKKGSETVIQVIMTLVGAFMLAQFIDDGRVTFALAGGLLVWQGVKSLLPFRKKPS
jgi:hypothetical protein